MLHLSPTTDEQPTLPKLICFNSKTRGYINIIDEVGAEYQTFGILLLEDNTGAYVQSLITNHQHHSKSINLEIVQKWL